MPKTIFTGRHTHLVAILKEARVKAGLRQSDLAERLGRAQGHISLIECGQRRIDVEEFFEIAQAIGVDPVELFAEVAKRFGQTGE